MAYLVKLVPRNVSRIIVTHLRMHLITAAFGMFLINHDCRGQEHLGCYADSRTIRLLPTLGEVSDNNTVDTCIHICKSIGETYAGVELSNECWCGVLHDFSGNGVAAAPDMKGHWCNNPCAGNASQLCGGLGHINVYSVCQRGRYSDPEGDVGNCDSECYCNASHICLYSTGQCPGVCQDGWYGASCSLTNHQITPHSGSTPSKEITLTEPLTIPSSRTSATGPSSRDAMSLLETNSVNITNSPAITTTGGSTPVTGIVAGTTVALLAILVILGMVIVYICQHRSKQGSTSSRMQPIGRMETTTEGVDDSVPLAHRIDMRADKYDVKTSSGEPRKDTGDTTDAAYYNTKFVKTPGGSDGYSDLQPKERIVDTANNTGVYEKPHGYMNMATEPTYTPLNQSADYQNIP